MGPLVSIVMPTYNAEPFIAEAIGSVLKQEYTNWELLIVDDASTDGTARIIERFTDPRIRVFHQTMNGGIGSARNIALEHVRGSLLCTFDSDDVLPPQSLSSRVALMEQEPDVDIADGQVVVFDRTLTNVRRTYLSGFVGEPLNELIALSGKCFFGPSWLVRWQPENRLRFCTEVTHAEDLIFYIEYAKGKRYKAIDIPILHYRVTGYSAMSKFDGLQNSYRYIERWLATRPDIASPDQAQSFGKRWRRIMFRTWLKARKPLEAMRVLFS